MRKELSRWNEPLLNSFESVFENFFSPRYAVTDSTWNFNPVSDVTETESHFLVSLDVPGVKAENLNVQIEGDMLVVSGERKDEVVRDEKGRHYRERSMGEFSRSFKLGPNADCDRIEAKHEDGVLHIAIPKAEHDRRSVKINDKTDGFFAKLLK